MKRLLPLILAACWAFCPLAPVTPVAKAAADATAPAPFREGDIIYQRLHTAQSSAIVLATGSPWTHCGIILNKNGKPHVFEAATLVTWTPLDRWIQRGDKQAYILSRLKDTSPLLPETIAAMKEVAAQFTGKVYDIYFQWSDDRMYCSELVWKLYARTGDIEITPLRRLREYNLNQPEVQRVLAERYADGIPWEELVIAPSDLLASPLFEVVEER